MNIPIINRLSKMFSAKKECRYNNALTKSMFTLIVNHKDAPDFENINSNEIISIFEECYTYIHRDRPLHLNKMIEASLKNETETYDELQIELERSDTYYMKSIIDIREYLYL